MRIKRMLTVLLTVCMLMGCFAPAATAAGRVPGSALVQKGKEEWVTTPGAGSELLLSDEHAGHGFKRHETSPYENRAEAGQNAHLAPCTCRGFRGAVRPARRRARP